MDASLQSYLEIAHAYYMEDRLDVAAQVVTDAFREVGWPPGMWTEFYNALQCEKDARDASALHRVDDTLTIELPRGASDAVYQDLESAAVEARRRAMGTLKVERTRPVMVTVFLPDAPVDFIVGSHGYTSHKTERDKICIPHYCTESRHTALDALLHEFYHVVTHQLAGQDVPSWLDEGLAVYLSRELAPEDMEQAREIAAEDDHLLTAGGLEGVFSADELYKDDPDLVYAAYTLAGSLVGHIVQGSGLEKTREALVHIGEGMDADDAIREATGTALREIECEWRERVESGS